MGSALLYEGTGNYPLIYTVEIYLCRLRLIYIDPASLDYR